MIYNWIWIGISSEFRNPFFDISKLSQDAFDQMIKFLEFCKKNRQDFLDREEEEKKVQDILNQQY
jgi:hypothetical protein